MIAYALTCEHMENPIGIDVNSPRLSWKCGDSSYQEAYQIQAAVSEEALQAENLIWDSGEVLCWDSLDVKYPLSMESGERVFWRVRLKEEGGTWGDWSQTAFFESGLLHDSEKSAQWINPEASYDIDSEPPVSLLRKEFEVEPGFLSARLYVSALGVYQAGLNGKKVGDQVLAPGFTDMDRRRQYQSYDVTDLLLPGQNAIGVALADGWARSRLGFSGKRNQFSTQLALWAVLMLRYQDGRKVAVQTDLSWKTTKEGPWRMSDLRDGEIYDARMELPGWQEAGFDDHSWEAVHSASYDGLLEGTRSTPVREIRRLKGQLLDTPDGRTVIDFGANIAGYVEFAVRGKAGDRVKLVHGEVLDKAGNFTMENFHFEGSPEFPVFCTKQEIEYTLSGKGEEVYKPSFAFMGFRYLLVEEWPGAVDPDCFTAIVICSDLKRTGEFSCSNELLNRFFQNTIRSQEGNFIGIPTDCPHRERMGWTGDAQIFCRTAATNFDVQAFFTKWFRDVATAQKETGEVPNTVPYESMPTEDGPGMPFCSSGWGDAVTIIPLKLYEVYGDKQLLADAYPSMKKWVDYEAASAASHVEDPDDPHSQYIWDSGFHWGEWLEPGIPAGSETDAVAKAETATAYFAHSAGLLSKAAAILGKQEDADFYHALAEKVRSAYVHRFTRDGSIDGGRRQCLYVRPLALSLLPEEKRQEAADRLNQLVIENGYHIGTGFLSTPYLCEVLTKGGYLETAYKMLLTTTPPSWLYPVTRGATTIWETWEGYDQNGEPLASHNHYAFGSVMEWVYRYMVGIDTEFEHPGYRRFRIVPRPGKEISSATARIDTARGIIECAWEKNASQFVLQFTVPSNTTADLVLPHGVEKVIDGGGLNFDQKDGEYTAAATPGTYRVVCAMPEQ